MLTNNDLQRLYAKAKAKNDTKTLRMLHQFMVNPLYHIKPRPDNEVLLDQQTSFLEDQFEGGLAIALGGNRAGKSLMGAVKAARFVLNTPPPAKLT